MVLNTVERKQRINVAQPTKFRTKAFLLLLLSYYVPNTFYLDKYKTRQDSDYSCWLL